MRVKHDTSGEDRQNKRRPRFRQISGYNLFECRMIHRTRTRPLYTTRDGDSQLLDVFTPTEGTRGIFK